MGVKWNYREGLRFLLPSRPLDVSQVHNKDNDRGPSWRWRRKYLKLYMLVEKRLLPNYSRWARSRARCQNPYGGVLHPESLVRVDYSISYP